MKGGGGPSGCQARGQEVCMSVCLMLTFCWGKVSNDYQKLEYKLNISYQLYSYFTALLLYVNNYVIRIISEGDINKSNNSVLAYCMVP